MYALVAAVQHDSHGEPAFVHRVTPGAKYDPTRVESLNVSYITTPLRWGLLHASDECRLRDRL